MPIAITEIKEGSPVKVYANIRKWEQGIHLNGIVASVFPGQEILFISFRCNGMEMKTAAKMDGTLPLLDTGAKWVLADEDTNDVAS